MDQRLVPSDSRNRSDGVSAVNFAPQPDPHKEAMERLSAQIHEYLATGKRIQDVPPGASGAVRMFGTTSRTKKKKASASNASTD